MPELLAKLSPNGSWLKMFGDSCQSLLWEVQGEDSELFSGTWPAWAILLDGVVMALPMLERRTNGNEYLLSVAGGGQRWPTATGSDYKGCGPTIIRKDGKNRQNDRLDYAVAGANWPTPRANDAEKRGAIANDPRNGLPGKVQNWPTPKVPSGGGQVQRNTAGGGIRKLEDAISVAVGYNTGQLNADWVEILMGYDIGYTDIDCDEPAEWPGWPAGLGEKLWRTAEAGDHCDRQFARNSRGEPKLSAQAQIMPHGQYLYEPPRVITGQKNRAKRLKCLGNSVVSQQAYPIFKAIMEVEDALQNQTARPHKTR